MARIYVEGGGDSKELHARCREGFRKLLGQAGFADARRMPRLVASGGRQAVFDDFRTAHGASGVGEYVAFLVDSEEPVIDIERPWDHLVAQAGWTRPVGATDDQALLMVTCMETWIACDPRAVQQRFGPKAKLNSLPAAAGLERRSRHEVLAALKAATKDCRAVYSKGAVSFEVLARLSPDTLKALSSFVRTLRVLEARL